MKKTIIKLSSGLLIAAIAFTACNKKPEANFTAAPTTVQPGEPVVFSDGVADRKNTTITYDFGDGSSSAANEQNVSHPYEMPGTYTATQNILSNKNANTGKGKYATTTTTITVKGAVAAFTSSPTSPKIGETVTFTNNTTNNDKGNAVTYTWWMVDATGTNFTFATTKNAWFTFGTNGTWTVYLEAWRNGRKESSASDVITVGTGESTFSTLFQMMATWTFVSDVSSSNVTGSTGSLGCANNTTTTDNLNGTANKVTIDVDGDMWVVRTGGFDQIKGDFEGTITIDMSSNKNIATISGFSWASNMVMGGSVNGGGTFSVFTGDTYTIKSLTSNSLVLESKIIDATIGGCGAIATVTRTITLSK